MVRVGAQLDEVILSHLVDDALNALTIESHASRQPRHRLRAWRMGDRAQYLPARTGKAEVRNEVVAGREQAPVEPEHRQDQIGQGLAAGRMSFGRH